MCPQKVRTIRGLSHSSTRNTVLIKTLRSDIWRGRNKLWQPVIIPTKTRLHSWIFFHVNDGILSDLVPPSFTRPAATQSTGLEWLVCPQRQATNVILFTYMNIIYLTLKLQRLDVSTADSRLTSHYSDKNSNFCNHAKFHFHTISIT